uniref:UDP-N-acetylglucosamine transferase subunit ALG14 homolog n=1 Tax=Styela clava TaxID=7725 RepID=UPI00193A5972|nr:UDP-N-acetylglucosamine transferase subunit ALG14 homolog [Styela clava]
MLVPILFCLLLFAILRLIWILKHLGSGLNLSGQKVKVLAIAGSGGHTAELLRLLSALSSNYRPICYVIADTDKMSANKIQQFETDRKVDENDEGYCIVTIPRSREVAQPWLSSVWTTLVATVSSFSIVWNSNPDLLLCNGPGTCIPLCFIAFLYKFLGIGHCQIIFAESICRVKSLSLSGLILYHFCDKMFVQWKELHEKYPKSMYVGRIV